MAVEADTWLELDRTGMSAPFKRITTEQQDLAQAMALSSSSLKALSALWKMFRAATIFRMSFVRLAQFKASNAQCRLELGRDVRSQRTRGASKTKPRELT